MKHTFLIVFSLSIILLTSMSHQALGESVVSTVNTRINYVSAGKLTTFVSTENTLESALAKQGITLEKNDLTEPAEQTKLTGQTLNVSRVPAIPVLVNDNGQSWVGNSAYKSKEDILKQLAVDVDKADKVSANIILDPVTENAIGQKIDISRAPVYTVNVDDKQVVVHSWNKTVGDVLTDGGVALNQNDTVDPVKADVAPATGQIIVTRINYADVDETVTIPYQTIQQNDYNLYQGQSSIVQTGSNGSKVQNVHIVYHDGVEVDRTLNSTSIAVAVQNKIVSVGVKPYSHQDLWNIMVQAKAKYGVDPSAMFNVMMCESGGNVNSGAGRAHQGLFQWDGSFYNWASKAGYPGANILDPNAQIFATALRVSQNGWSAWSCKP